MNPSRTVEETGLGGMNPSQAVEETGLGGMNFSQAVVISLQHSLSRRSFPEN